MAGRYFGIPFATSGDKIVVPDATQPDGSVSFTQGFGFDYERTNADPDYKPVPREGTNGLFHDITEALGIVQKQGVADWTASAQPYPINALVRHNDVVWQSKVGTNNVEPVEGASWTAISNNISDYPPGFTYNATVSVNVADSEHDLDIPKFSLRNDDNDTNVDAATSLIKQMDVTFAEGTNAGGMAAGQTLPTSGFFHVFAVTNDADGTVDVMGDVSPTGANINAGWTAQKKIARVETDASANIIAVVNYYRFGDWVFESSEQALVAGGAILLSHDLGIRPSGFSVELVCKVAEAGYSIGDHYIWPFGFGESNSANSTEGVSIVPNETDLDIRYSDTVSGVFTIITKSGGSYFSITTGNWKMIVRAKR